MKRLIFALAAILVFTQLSFAAEKTTIEFQLRGEEYIQNSSKEFPIKFLNKELKAKGLPEFPDVVVFGKTDVPYQKKLMKDFEKANKALKREIQPNIDNKYFYELPTIRYRGNTSEVMGVIKALLGSVLHPEQGIQAARFGKTKIIYYKDQFFGNNAEIRKGLEENGQGKTMKIWDNYDTKSDTVLIMSDYGPQGDGTELTATQIAREK